MPHLRIFIDAITFSSILALGYLAMFHVDNLNELIIRVKGG